MNPISNQQQKIVPSIQTNPSTIPKIITNNINLSNISNQNKNIKTAENEIKTERPKQNVNMLQVEELINKNFIEAQNLEKLEESKPKPEKKEEKREARIPGPTLNPSLCTSPKTMAFFHINKVKVNPNNEEQKKLMENKIKNEELNKNINNKNILNPDKQEKNKKIISLLTATVPLENPQEEKNNQKIKFKIEEINKNSNNNTNITNYDLYEPYPEYDYDYYYDILYKKDDKKFLEKKTNRDYNNRIPEIPSYYTSFAERVDSGTQTVKNIEMIDRSTSCERMNVNPTKLKILNLINEYSYQEVFDALMKYYFPNYECNYSAEVIKKIANLVNDISLDQIVSYIISIGNSRQEVIKVNMKPYKEKELSSQEEEIDYEDNEEENDTIEIMEHDI